MTKTIALESDFVDIFIVPISLSGKRYNDLKAVAIKKFYDWLKRDEDEAIYTEMKRALEKAGFKDEDEAIYTEMKRALEKAGFKENVDYKMLWVQVD